MSLSDEAYEQLLALRTGLRRFQRWSEQQARAAGLTPAQHQLLLAIRGHPDPRGPTVGEVADYLLLRHHSTIGLVDRAEEAGLVTRTRDEHDQRVVRLGLTIRGRQNGLKRSRRSTSKSSNVSPPICLAPGKTSTRISRPMDSREASVRPIETVLKEILGIDVSPCLTTLAKPTRAIGSWSTACGPVAWRRVTHRLASGSKKLHQASGCASGTCTIWTGSNFH